MAGAREILEFQVLCPAGTPRATPQTVDLDMPTRTVYNIRVRVPPGPDGYMGFAIGSTNTSVIPYGDGQFIIAADEVFDWPLVDQIDSGSWQAIMYNEGEFDHTIYILFTVELPDLPDAQATTTPIAPVLISSPPTVAAPAPSSPLPPPPELT